MLSVAWARKPASARGSVLDERQLIHRLLQGTPGQKAHHPDLGQRLDQAGHGLHRKQPLDARHRVERVEVEHRFEAEDGTLSEADADTQRG
jgi:hypothetical protein